VSVASAVAYVAYVAAREAFDTAFAAGDRRASAVAYVAYVAAREAFDTAFIAAWVKS
jgi:hypothetical protein